MALVAYDYGSGSDDEGDGDAPISSVGIVKERKIDPESNSETPSVSIETTEDVVTEHVPEILSHLPESKAEAAVNITDDKLEDFIPKYEPAAATKEKKPQKVKIAIPSLSEFEEEDEPQQKKVKRPVQGSSLLSMLPPVRGTPLSTKSFIPNILKNKPKPSEKKQNNGLVPHAVRKKAEEVRKATIKKITKTEGSDAESDDDIELPESFDDEMWHKVCGPKSKPKPQIIEPPEEVVILPEINIAPEPEAPYEGLDNAAFKELVGKAKRPINIKLIDINEEEILQDKDLYLTKSLTDPDSGPKNVVEDPVDPTRKKKHHITYLAEQAKANEQELQSQWSSSKYTRNQTRAKYGF